MPRIYCLAFVLSTIGSSSYAQHDAMVELYGEGVHRYFCNDFSGADQILSTVVDGGSEDPRAHYFRGLARERAGMGGELDFEMGAKLEAAGKRSVDVGQALIRIQGQLRAKIEEARRDARILVKQQQLMAEQARAYLQPASGTAAAVPPPSTAGTSPFPTELEPASGIGMEPAPSTPEVSNTSNPFGDEPAPPATPDAPATDAGTSPFGEPATPTTEPAGEGNPFGEPPADGGNPFGL